MAKGEFYIVYINRKPDVSYEAVKKSMDSAIDWYRINPTLWVLYTTSDQEKWYERLSKHVLEDGRLFICKLDTTARQGWMGENFWKWLQREEDNKK